MNEPTRITIANSSSILSFEKPSSGPGPEFDRYLMIENKRAYHIGNICGTCEFLFERLDGANKNISATNIAERLNAGINITESAFTEALSRILPDGSYFVNFPIVRAQLITPGDPDDYFINEQVDLWGLEPFYALPHNPKIMYYRSRSIALGKHSQLFEFIIPMFPHTWLNPERLTHYRNEISSGVQPTAFALSILDVKQPAVWNGNPNPQITEHWCLAHYLLDGHHKIHAASQLHAPLKLVSFLAIDESVASPEKIRSALPFISS
jgi:hypothetical protein